MTNTNTEKKNIPELRFPEFSGEWERKKLGDVAERVVTKNTLNSVTTVLTNSAIQGIVNQNEYFDKEIANQNNLLNYYIVSRNDFVYNPRISNDAPVGPIKRNHIGKGVMSPLYFVFRFVYGDFNFYEEYFFSKFWHKYMKSIANYGARHDRMNITIAEFYNMPILIPSLPEQKRIASFFTVIDDRLSQLKKKKELLEQYKKGMMQRIFSQEIRFKDENGNDYPKWQEKKLGEVYSFRSTNSFSREMLNYTKGEIRNLHYGDIHKEFRLLFDITRERVPFINLDIKPNNVNKDNFCEKGDLIFADASEDYADIGKCIEIVNICNERILAGLHTIHAKSDSQNMAIGFGGYLMNSFSVRLQIKRISQGTKVLSISPNRLANVLLLLPSLPEQQKIANFLSAIDEKISQVNTQIEHTEEYKKGLLQKMFI